MKTTVSPSLTFLTGGGQMAARIADHDWRATALGPIEHWPAALRTALGLALNSRFPTFLCWGAELISFYNDAYAPLLGTSASSELPQRLSGRVSVRRAHDLWLCVVGESETDVSDAHGAVTRILAA